MGAHSILGIYTTIRKKIHRLARISALIWPSSVCDYFLMCVVLVGANAAPADRVLVGVKRMSRANCVASRMLHALAER